MATKHYIAIEGVIGVGKTTLARLLQPLFGAQLLLEVTDKNPFLSDFYADRERYAFQTQIFFLLSRYRQQYDVLPRLLHQTTAIGDYTFAKDRLFARLNLRGEELATYERLYTALAEKLPRPNLVVYLYADTPVLLHRIAARDRAYERSISVDYIERLRLAYETFFAESADSPTLRIDTNRLDPLRHPEHLADIEQRIRSVLREGAHQVELSRFQLADSPRSENTQITLPRGLTDLQQWRRTADANSGLDADPYYGMLRLQGQVGELARVLSQIWAVEEALLDQYGNREEALHAAMEHREQALREPLADCLAQILRLANRLGVDLESTYHQHMRHNAAPAPNTEQNST